MEFCNDCKKDISKLFGCAQCSKTPFVINIANLINTVVNPDTNSSTNLNTNLKTNLNSNSKDSNNSDSSELCDDSTICALCERYKIKVKCLRCENNICEECYSKCYNCANIFCDSCGWNFCPSCKINKN